VWDFLSGIVVASCWTKVSGADAGGATSSTREGGLGLFLISTDGRGLLRTLDL